MKHLLKFMKPYKKEIFVLMLFYAVQTFCALFMPYVMGNIVEFGVQEGNVPYIWKQSFVMLGLAVGALVSALVTNKVNCKFVSGFTVDMRKAVFNKVNKLTLEQFSNVGTGSLITRTTDDIGWMEETLSMIPYVLVAEPIMFIGGVVLSLLGDWLLAVILLGAAIIVLLVVSQVTGKLEGLWKRGDEFTDVQNRIIRERLSGIRVIRAFDREQYEHKRAEFATTEMCKCFVRSNTTSQIIEPIASFALNMTTVAIIYVGSARLGKDTTLLAGNIIATIQYIALIVNAILTLSWTFAFIPHVKVSMGRIGEVLDLPADEDGESSGEIFDGSLEFKNVDFSYYKSETPTLSDINLDIKPGEIVGIIGGTGSGKSTLVKLIMNLYHNVDGVRKIGGKSFDEVTPATVRDNVSVALQKSMIFEGTIAENIKMGNDKATDEQIKEVLQISQLDKFVNAQKEGVEYKLNQSGSNISGGQKQRINIARAILKPASIYIFDDSFSALDYLTEANLRKALNKYLDGKTQIIITQRAATAMRCDKVYVLDRGKVVGFGTHKELLDSCNIYREIYNSQLGGGNLE